ncbi:hypothetical protein FRB99_004905 [Tulasnella sp. 403]|nr:hypothetical protein FRB99_004905 [Tulasnella sp. 403]
MSASNEEKVVPPRTYVFERVGSCSARITERVDGSTGAIGPSSPASPEKAVGDMNATDAGVDIADDQLDRDDEQVPDGTGGYFLKRKKLTYTLYDNSKANESLETATALIKVDLPPLWSFTVAFTEVAGAKRQATMYKMGGPEPHAWYSINRTLVDFDGVVYTWKNKVFVDDLTLLRSDGVVVAHFDRRRFAFNRGVLVRQSLDSYFSLAYLFVKRDCLKSRFQSRSRFFGFSFAPAFASTKKTTLGG